MKISKQKLKKIIAEEIANVEEGLFSSWTSSRSDRLKDRRRPSGKPASAGADFDTEKLAGLDSSEDMDTFGKGLKGKYSDAYDSAASYSDFKDQKQDDRGVEVSKAQADVDKVQDAHINQSDDALYTKIQRLEKTLNDMSQRIADLQQSTGEAPPEDVIPTAGMEVEDPKTMQAAKRAEKQARRKRGRAKRKEKEQNPEPFGQRELNADGTVNEEMRKILRHTIKEELRKILRHKR